MTKQYKNIAIWVLMGLTAIVSLYLTLVLSIWFLYSDKAYPGVTVAGESVAGKSRKEIERIVAVNGEKTLAKKITFETTPVATVSAESLGLTVDAPATAKAALSWGNANTFLLGRPQDLPIVYKIDQTKYYPELKKILAGLETPAADPDLKLEGGQITAAGGSVGGRVNLAETSANLLTSLKNSDTKVKLAVFTINPSFSVADVSAQRSTIEKATEAPIVLAAGLKEYLADSATQVSWITLSGTQPVYGRIGGDDILWAPINSGGTAGSLFSSPKISNYLTDLSGKINTAPANASLAARDGAVVVTAPSADGQALNVARSTEAVLAALSNGLDKASLVVDVIRPTVREDNLAELGLSELVSSGYTNFSGSPKNRIHNVRTGASKFNGVLIKPDEKFSFNTTLGPVDASTGYLPELVILVNKTVPEFGGGMCQVSSTAFRAALNAGMPIVARRNHSYPVSYYKPYGVDATIYLPQPDLVFTNDTGHYILIQTHIEGYKLTFDFYGTKPNRKVSFAGSGEGVGAVPIVEKITPLIYDKEARGRASFTAQFWRFIYDESGALIKKSTWVSKYDSPDKYPH